MLGLTAGSRVGDRVALRYRRALADAQCSKVCERSLVAVARSDRHREAVRRHLPGERNLACGRCHNCAGASQRDVDASMLTGGVRVGPDGELAKDRSVRRPRPRPCRRAGRERPDHRGTQACRPARCPASEHGATVARTAHGGNAVDRLVTESRGRARSARRQSAARPPRQQFVETLRTPRARSPQRELLVLPLHRCAPPRHRARA